MSKVVFLFMSKGSATENGKYDDSYKYQAASPHYQEVYGDESYFKMFQTLLDNKVITDLKVFFESGVGSGKAAFVKGADCYVIPQIKMVAEYIEEDTIIFVRGGFRHWHDFLFSYKNKNWLICYAANTGRDKWPWWDVVFDDLEMSNIIDERDRYRFPFIKPTNESVFNPMAATIEYDICIGASNIHDKKGQFRTIILLEEFKKLFGYYPSAVMPGAFRRSKYTVEMINKPFFQNEIHCPGMLSKQNLNKLFAKCKIFIHLGSGGQNDRSILEAAAAGLPVVFTNTSRFTPLLIEDGTTTFIFSKQDSLQGWAHRLKSTLDNYTPKDRITRYYIYKEKMGYKEVVIPMLTTFFNILGDTPVPNMITKERLVQAFRYIEDLL